MKHFSLLSGSFALIGAMMLLLWWCMSPSAIQPNAKVSLSYTVTDPETMELVASGVQKDILFDFTGSALFQLLEGVKKNESKTWILTDPFAQHDENLVQKQTTLVLNEMGISLEVGEKLEVSGQPVVITQIVSEDGIEQAVLDGNPIETIFPLEWEFTITEIK